MGNSLSSVIKGVIGDSDDDKATRDTLNALYALGKSRTENALAEAQNSTNTIYAPINKVIFQKQKIVCNTAVSADKIVDDIKGGIGNLLQGQILDGVTDIVKEGLNIVLGESSGQIASENTYALIATDIGALMRIDIDIYNFETSTTRLQNTAKRVTAVTMLISSVKLEAMHPNDLRAIVSLKYSSSSQQRQMEILELVTAAYKKDAGKSPMAAEELAAYRSLFKPSEYEEAAIKRGTLTNGGPKSTSVRHRQDRSDVVVGELRSRLKGGAGATKASPKNGFVHANGAGGRASKLAANGGHHANGSEGRPHAAADPPVEALPISLVVPLCKVVDVVWVKRMHAYLEGFVDAGMMLKSEGVPTDIGGTAVTFKFSVSSAAAFPDAVNYFKKVIIPDISSSGTLIDPCSSFQLEYTNVAAKSEASPSTKAVFLGPSVQYDRVKVTNTTRYRMGFYGSDGTRILLVQPNATATLTGNVNYLSPNDYAQWRLSHPTATAPPAESEMALSAQYTGQGDQSQLRSLTMAYDGGDDSWTGVYNWEMW